MDEYKVFDRGKDELEVYGGDSEILQDPTSDVPHVMWDIEPLALLGTPVPTHRLASLPYARQSRSSPVIRRDAKLVTQTGEGIPINLSMLDTGSTTYSFISSKCAESVQQFFPIQKLSHPTTVKLGDNKTLKALDSYIIAPMVFCHHGREHRGTIQFYVFDSGYDIIVGMPDILQYFATFICAQILAESPTMASDDLLYLMKVISISSYDLMDEIVVPMRQLALDAHNRATENREQNNSRQKKVERHTLHKFDAEINYSPSDEGLKPPWSKPVDLCAPEDEFDMSPA